MSPVVLSSAADRHLVILDAFLGGGTLQVLLLVLQVVLLVLQVVLLLLIIIIDGWLCTGTSHRRGIIASNFSSTNLRKTLMIAVTMTAAVTI